MYLSRVALDKESRETLQAMSLIHHIHGAVEQSFSGERKRRLWRIDEAGDNLYLLVVSEDKPNFESLLRQFGKHGDSWETKEYTPFLSQIKTGEKLRFKLCANPVWSNTQKKDSKGRGKVFAHTTPAQQKEWLVKRSTDCGFSMGYFDVTASEWKKFRKGRDGGREVSIRAVTFEGFLTVTDAEKFRETLQNGIGREKAYGCGMMTVMRI